MFKLCGVFFLSNQDHWKVQNAVQEIQVIPHQARDCQMIVQLNHGIRIPLSELVPIVVSEMWTHPNMMISTVLIVEDYKQKHK